jgi:tetratricopeptide (TPR) repeat protein
VYSPAVWVRRTARRLPSAASSRDSAGPQRQDPGRVQPERRRRGHHKRELLARLQQREEERGGYFLHQPLSQRTLQAALERFDAALRESPGYAPACVGMGRAWFNLACGWYLDPRPAAEHAKEALQRAPEHAQHELDALMDIVPDSMPVHGLMGILAMLRGDARSAIAHYRRTCELAPEYPACLASVAAAQAMAGCIEEADRTMAQLRRRFAGRPSSPYVEAIVATPVRPPRPGVRAAGARDHRARPQRDRHSHRAAPR